MAMPKVTSEFGKILTSVANFLAASVSVADESVRLLTFKDIVGSKFENGGIKAVIARNCGMKY